MDPSRFKITLALTLLSGIGYLTYDFAAGLLNPIRGISGTVHLEGRPLPQGIVQFVSLDPVETHALEGIIKDGRYEIPEEYGLEPARYQVVFSSIGPEELQRLVDARARGEEPPDIKEEVPARFNRNSEVRVDLRSGAILHADFDLR
mgnify:CR=1 FL=1